ncbi:MAG: LytTR family transcriptional regulator [Paludibacteraceae bacterium]|nr:LytTR family transcriptional regulator [Paludibacteraceae bacterium]
MFGIDSKTYFKSRHNVILTILGLIALSGLCVLFFKPYRIYTWVEAKQTMLLWAEIGVLSAMVLVMAHKLKSKHDQIATLHANSDEAAAQVQMFNFYDERGELKLSVKPENLYYLESADNYVQIHYWGGSKMQALLIRNSMKNIEWRFRETPLIRCHRSYIVNLEKVQMVKRIDGEMMLDFNDEQIANLPVSKAYADQIMIYFAK